MTPLHHTNSHAWSLEYEKKGRLWGNAPSIKPPAFPSPSPASPLIYLDLGVGDGKCFRGISTIDSHITLLAVDFSTAALHLCPQQIERICADAIQLPFHDKVVDRIYAHHVLGHIPVEERTCAVNEILRIAKPGAMIWVVVFERQDFRAGKGQISAEEYTYIRGNGIMTHYFTKEEILQMFSCCTQVYIKLHQWSMQIRGVSYQRSMIEGLFSV
ncbi:MAG: class I SAM-dependent methyltransferase [Methanomicrobiales archaeon]|nr:class I SAM-dependent methyltransferase [Methanomicrobiales archaeon]